MGSNKQIILCIESSGKNSTDDKYIREVINHFYDLGENKLSFVYMNGKFSYQHPDVRKSINKLKKDYKVYAEGESKVIYCFDKDLNYVDHRDNEFVNNVQRYCHTNGYDIVWFIRTIEEVMLGSKVAQKDKAKSALNFIRNNKVYNLNFENISCDNNVNAKRKSNILTILSQYLSRKEA